MAFVSPQEPCTKPWCNASVACAPSLTLLFPMGTGFVGRVAQLVRALLSHSRGPGFESLRAHSMKVSISHVAASVLLVATIATAGGAQQTGQLPTAAQAQQLLQNPDMVNQLRQQLTTSGLTPDQVRARLTAEGYPANLLDAYLPGGTAGARDSIPGDDVFNAMRALGVSDSASVETLRTSSNQYQRAMRVRRDSLAGRNIDPRTGLPRAESGDTIKKPASEKIFGLDVFRYTSTEFQPNLSGPVDANSRLGPGDQLVLILTGDVELTRTLDVTREGFVLIPQVGQISPSRISRSQNSSRFCTRDSAGCIPV